MLDKVRETVQLHLPLLLILLVGGFVFLTMAYKWLLDSSAARKKAAKSSRDQAAKSKTEKSKKRKQKVNFVSRWVLSIAFLVVLLIFFYMYAWPL